MAYSAQTWTFLRTLYETGRYKSLDSLWENVSKTIKKCPSRGRLHKVAAKERWLKFGLRDKIEGEIEKSITDKFAELGMPEERVVRLCIDGMLAGEHEIEKISEIVAESIKTRYEVDSTEVKAALKELNNNLMIRQRYLQTYLQMVGRAPKPGGTWGGEQPRPGHGKRSEFLAPRDIPDETLSEKIKELHRLVKEMDDAGDS